MLNYPPAQQLESRLRQIMYRRLQGSISSEEEIPLDIPILGKGLGLDSLEAMLLVIEIETEFDIMFGDEELTIDLFQSIGSLAENVRQKLSTTNSPRKTE